MPFGASILAGGGVRFRLWAPAAQSVELLIAESEAERCSPLAPGARGWFDHIEPEAQAGCLYRYRIDGHPVPDPASRFNPQDVHGPSEVIDPEGFDWQDAHWKGRPWEEAVIYELHTGAFSSEGTFAAVESRLDYLAALGITVVELMPVADFPGRRGWGYDGVLPFAPDASYGRPEALKRLVQAAHRRGLMVMLDVVYNHFGPEGNYLHRYAPQFFTERHRTPWGAGINFDGPGSQTVRSFFIHNALYWLEEFHLDGLRLDAVHAIQDDTDPDFLSELARSVREGPGRARRIHLVLENERNSASRLERDAAGRPRQFTAQWNDDFHHAAHVLLTGEQDGYYCEFPTDSASALARCLAEGFVHQGESSRFRDGQPRGEPSAQLPPGAFVQFLQNHDQVGNRALGERLALLAEEPARIALAAVLLLSPAPPLLFMGEEFGAGTPFLFFADFSGALGQATREGRLREFSRFAKFQDPRAAAAIPDPQSEEAFQRSKLAWDMIADPAHQAWLQLTRELLDVRRREIIPLQPRLASAERTSRVASRALEVRWALGEAQALVLRANLAPSAQRLDCAPEGRVLYATRAPAGAELPPWSVSWLLVGRR